MKDKFKQIRKEIKPSKQPQALVKTNPAKEVSHFDFTQLCLQSGIKKIKNDTVVLAVKAPVKTSKINSSTLSFGYDFEYLDEENAKNEFFRFGQRLMPKELRAGKHIIVAKIDLHSYTKSAALDLLAKFINNNLNGGCIRVVHGKGLHSGASTPVLKNAVRKYLEYNERVLGFSYANENQGGDGATLVILKKRD